MQTLSNIISNNSEKIDKKILKSFDDLKAEYREIDKLKAKYETGVSPEVELEDIDKELDALNLADKKSKDMKIRADLKLKKLKSMLIKDMESINSDNQKNLISIRKNRSSLQKEVDNIKAKLEAAELQLEENRRAEDRTIHIIYYTNRHIESLKPIVKEVEVNTNQNIGIVADFRPVLPDEMKIMKPKDKPVIILQGSRDVNRYAVGD